MDSSTLAGATGAPKGRRDWSARVLEFFRYHGPLAPGVRLLRNLPMRGKASLVGVAFTVPVSLLVWHYATTSGEAVAVAEQERAGLAHLVTLGTLADVLREQSRELQLREHGQAPARPAPERAVAASLYAELQQSGRVWQSSDVKNRRDALAQSWGLLESVSSSRRGDLIGKIEPVLQAVADYRDPIVNESGLALDPQADTYFLMRAATQTLPQLQHRLAALRRQLGGLSDTGTQADWRLRLQVAESRATAAQILNDSREALLQARLAGGSLSAEQVESVLRPVDVLLARLTGLLDGTDAGAAAGLVGELTREADQAAVRLQALQVGCVTQLDEALVQRIDRVEAQRLAVAWTVAAGLALAFYLLMSFYRVMNGGLVLLRRQVALMASGDLSARPRPWGNDEVASALSSLGASLARLADLFAAVRQGVAAAAQASHAIASGTSDLTDRTERNAAGLSQIMDGVTRYIDQLDECGRRVDVAVEAVQAMRLDSARSRKHMDRLHERMRSLRGKSREIGEIVGLIDGIAFRTNILALNASVEAAKAGEAGRGFAVVAQEVRALAMRSADSARRISDIVNRSTEDIEQSSSLTERAAQTLQDTEGQVSRIHAAMHEIVALTRAGQVNSQEILEEIRGLNATTAENSKLVAQMAVAADGLSQQGDHLNDKVATFKLD